MKHLLFEELLVMSRRERAARRVKLHRSSTVIKGANDTGKSSLLKSLYWTLGAEPPAIHTEWQDANVYSSLRFSVDGTRYRMIRTGSRFSLFDANDQLIGTYNRVTSELGPQLAELFDFRLLLSSKSEEEVQATPAFLFLPFYIDQDRGWSAKLNSFAHLAQFNRPTKDVLYFHFGIRPSAYYLAKSRYSDAEKRSLPLQQDRTTIESVLDKLEKRLKAATFSIDTAAFKEEVERLLERGEALRQEEEEQKYRMSEAYASLSAAKNQIRITKAALDDLRADQTYATAISGEAIECPTCHAEYENGFAERFSIAVDEDRCLGMLQELDEELRSAESTYTAASTATEAARELSKELGTLLQKKKGKLKLDDLVRSESRKETRRVLDEEIRQLNEAIGELDAIKVAAKAEMKSFEDKKRTKEILDLYRGEMGALLDALDVRTLPPKAYKDPASQIKETGSDLPRAILAFFLSSLRTIENYSTCAMCPIVIDTPKQQDPDDESWSRIRDAIKDRRPKGSQLILALADDSGTDFGGDVLELKDKYSVLRNEEYDSVAEELMPLHELALRSGLDEGEGTS